ncbi:ImmA/IrrE family metallo-endopeptidase [Delftia acidovorans]|uniref:ImmA/IrrE family metallo-endopeptidase n=1 Tax=Delftia acidovorans TaxID=80866 RepID=UPI00333FAD57
MTEAEQHGIHIYEKCFKSNALGLIKGNKIGISKALSTTIEKACILAEELGHYHTTEGNILDQLDIRNRKQELRARQWAYQCMIPLHRIVQAHLACINGRYDLAEYLGVTEGFLQAAIDRYSEKYGIFVTVDQYVVCFDPLYVVHESQWHGRYHIKFPY